jgi:hypothetical protein
MIKIKDLEKLNKVIENVPKAFSITVQLKILKNLPIISQELQIYTKLKSNIYTEDYLKYHGIRSKLSENDRKEIIELDQEYSKTISEQEIRIKEFEEYSKEDFQKSSDLIYINIDDLPDDLSQFDEEFLEGLFLITK